MEKIASNPVTSVAVMVFSALILSEKFESQQKIVEIGQNP